MEPQVGEIVAVVVAAVMASLSYFAGQRRHNRSEDSTSRRSAELEARIIRLEAELDVVTRDRDLWRQRVTLLEGRIVQMEDTIRHMGETITQLRTDNAYWRGEAERLRGDS